MINFEKLYKPYSKDGASLNQSLSWLKRTTGVTDEIVQETLVETMMFLDGGGSFPVKGCECGCELTNAHSALNHHMRDIALEKNDKAVNDYWNRTQTMLQNAIKSHDKAKKPKYKSFRLYRKGK